MSKIISVKAREILDSRGNPTVEVKLKTERGSGIAAVPSGASTGVHEALELRDGDPKRFRGLGVLKAVLNVNNQIAGEIVSREYTQETLDQALINLDGTPNKANLGANAILGVSLAFARAMANEGGVELYEYLGNLAGNKNFSLPQPMFNIINGGKHADSGLNIQEFMLAPVGFPTFSLKVQAAAEIIAALKKILTNKGYAVSVGDEGGFAPKLTSNEEAIELMIQAITEAGYTTETVKIGMDVAASNLYKNGTYHLKIKGEEKELTGQEMISWYRELVNTYPIIFIEDGLAEDDWDNFSEMTRVLGEKIKIVGDDLLVTNIKRIEMAIEKKAVNSVLIKLNQIGTLTETIQAIQMTKSQNWIPFVSHRSGETIDTFIADLAVGLSSQYLKSGSLARGERIAKYNRLMEIEDQLLSR